MEVAAKDTMFVKEFMPHLEGVGKGKCNSVEGVVEKLGPFGFVWMMPVFLLVTGSDLLLEI